MRLCQSMIKLYRNMRITIDAIESESESIIDLIIIAFALMMCVLCLHLSPNLILVVLIVWIVLYGCIPVY